MGSRSVGRTVPAMETSDGAGVRLRRTLGSPALDHLDPFLLLDEFKSDDSADYIAGFPDHPHRGFETVTYMLAGSMEHRDHSGHSGSVVPGGVQWMTAGRGIIHSEMPRQADGLMWGFQLWVNLPASDKMCPPRYQEFPPEAVPEWEPDQGGRARLVAGESAGMRGPVTGIASEPLYLDVSLAPGGRFVQAVPEQHNACSYVFAGAVTFAGTTVEAGNLAVLEAGDRIEARSESGGRFLLLTGRPLGEPVARLGPFVMNTRAELLEAAEDFRSGRF